jgi:hypothetical protein
VLGIVVWSVFIRGVKALDLNFFTKGLRSSASRAAASRRRSSGR